MEGQDAAAAAKLPLLDAFRQRQRALCWAETTDRGDVHPVMREFGIVSGYRHTGRAWAYYLRSLVHLHNETVNCMTHGMGALVMLAVGAIWTLIVRESADSRDVALAWLFCLMSALLQGISCIAHLLHSRSELWHCCLFFADNAAVGLSGFANNLNSIAFFSSPAFFLWLGPAALPLLVLGAVALSASFSLALAAYRRSYCLATSLLMFGPSGCFLLFGMAPIVHRQLELGPQADLLGVLHYSVFLLSVAAYAGCFPERCWPGHFDLLGHSHQIFHCLVTASHALQLSAVFAEIQRDSVHLFSKRPANCVSVTLVCWALGLTAACNAAVVLLYVKVFSYDTRFRSKAAVGKND